MANSVDILARGIATSAFTKAKETKTILEQDINNINSKISSAASSTNKLMDKDYIDDSINSMAAYYITKNAQGDQFDTRAELMSAQTFYSGGVVRVPSKNDYCIVAADEAHDGSVTRYIYNSQWEYQYTVNESPMSAAQLAALNSGITAQDVAKINSFDQNKLPLVPNLTLYDQVYYQQAKTSGIGGTKLMPMSPSNIANTIIQRSSNGRAQIADPVNDGDIANKGYVDNSINSVKAYVFSYTTSDYQGEEYLEVTQEFFEKVYNCIEQNIPVIYDYYDEDQSSNIRMQVVNIDYSDGVGISFSALIGNGIGLSWRYSCSLILDGSGNYFVTFPNISDTNADLTNYYTKAETDSKIKEQMDGEVYAITNYSTTKNYYSTDFCDTLTGLVANGKKVTLVRAYTGIVTDTPITATLYAVDVYGATVKNVYFVGHGYFNDAVYVFFERFNTNNRCFLTGYSLVKKVMISGTDYVIAGQKEGTSVGNRATIEGLDNTASGARAHAGGNETVVSGLQAFGHGTYLEISGYSGAGFGGYGKVLQDYGFSAGLWARASAKYQTVLGRYNSLDTVDESGIGNYIFIIGNGTSQSAVRNIFTVGNDGDVSAKSFAPTGADYAEFFEWLDGNPDNEDRIGRIVTLDGDKIRLANYGDDILGIISGTVGVLGDNYESEWHKRYLTDDYGRLIYEEYEAVEIIVDEDGNEVEKRFIDIRPKTNPDYDPETPYIPRKDRKEWSPVGMLGKLYVTDDGTCKVNQFVNVAGNGIATISAEKTNMRMLKRINEHIIQVLLK